MYCHNTIHGLNDWAEAMFEKLGWMVLACHHNKKRSILGYLEGLKTLHSCIKRKKLQVESKDNQVDLDELSVNIEILITFVEKTLLAQQQQQQKLIM